MSELKPCPFTPGCKPEFPDAKDVFGTFYEWECECGMVQRSTQIIDHFDHPRVHIRDSWNEETSQYGIEVIEQVRQNEIAAWNTRANTLPPERVDELAGWIKVKIRPGGETIIPATGYNGGVEAMARAIKRELEGEK